MTRKPLTQDGIVFKTAGVASKDDTIALVKSVKQMVLAGDWSGTLYPVAVSSWIEGMPGHLGMFIGCDMPRDNEAMTDILLAHPSLESVKFHRNFEELASSKTKAVSRVKKEPKKDVVLNKWGHNEAMISPRFLYLYEEEALEEGVRFRQALLGYPFKDRSARDNQTYIEMEIIARLRAKYPNIYQADQLIGGKVTAALKALSKPENQTFLPPHWHQGFAEMFCPGRHMGSLDGAPSDITGWYAYRDKIGEEKMRKILGRKRVDVEDETAIDPVIGKIAEGRGRALAYDRDTIDVLVDAEDTHR